MKCADRRRSCSSSLCYIWSTQRCRTFKLSTLQKHFSFLAQITGVLFTFPLARKRTRRLSRWFPQMIPAQKAPSLPALKSDTAQKKGLALLMKSRVPPETARQLALVGAKWTTPIACAAPAAKWRFLGLPGIQRGLKHFVLSCLFQQDEMRFEKR